MGQFKEDKEFKFDPNPMFACDVKYDPETGNGYISHAPAFDPKHGPESQWQIDWHVREGTPGAGRWEVGRPAAPFS